MWHDSKVLARVTTSRWAFPVSSGLLAFGWAFIAWLTVVPNQDILADGIQAQSFLTHPQFFLAFPGQKHGGPIEYPATIVAEALWPGNYFMNAAVRPLFAFATGFTAALLFRRLFDQAPRWAFLLSVAFGPAILSGVMGPESNPFGVIWLQPNYDLAWLFVISGSLLLAATLHSQSLRARIDPGTTIGLCGASLGAGLLVGLGFWAHPVFILLIIPLLCLVTLRSTWSWRLFPWFVTGGLVGVMPAVISYFVNADVNVWDPSHGAFIAVDYYISKGGSILGLDGIPDYILALLPWGWGWAPTAGLGLETIQSVSMWIVLIGASIITVGGVARSVRQRRRPSVLASIATTWVVAVVTLFAFITFVDAVWLYAVNYAFLLWFTIGAAPIFFAKRIWGITIATCLLTIEAVSMVIHNIGYLSSIPQNFNNKVSVMERNIEVARDLEEAGVDVVFGSYYDAIPIGYGSGGDLRTITSRYNRYPLTSEELAGSSLVVAVDATPTEPWGDESLDLVLSECQPRPEALTTAVGPFVIADCDPHVLDIRR